MRSYYLQFASYGAENVLTITSIFAAILGLMLFALSFQVSLRRMKVGANDGDGGDETLRRRIRAQGNFIEYAPLALILLALVEMAQAQTWSLWGLGGLLLAGRAAHALGMLAGSTPLRALGMIMTYSSILLSSGWLIGALLN